VPFAYATELRGAEAVTDTPDVVSVSI